jgi:hypothetical protein
VASEIVYDTWLWGDGEEMLWGDDVPIIMRHEITDLAFLQWLRDQSARVALLAEAKFAYQSSGVPAEGTLYFSDRPYVSETPQPYVAAIEGAPARRVGLRRRRA